MFRPSSITLGSLYNYHDWIYRVLNYESHYNSILAFSPKPAFMALLSLTARLSAYNAAELFYTEPYPYLDRNQWTSFPLAGSYKGGITTSQRQLARWLE